MILKSDYSTIVIVGIWNKGIFNLEWVSKFLLPKEKKLNVEIEPLPLGYFPKDLNDLECHFNRIFHHRFLLGKRF